MIRKKRICVFGDSLVSNEYYELYDNWVLILLKYVSKLNENNLVYNQGISGETTCGLLKRIGVEAKARAPNIIVLHIGSNDTNIMKNKINTSEKKFIANFKEIIKLSKKYTKEIIVTGFIPCDESKTTPTIWDENEFCYNRNLKIYNELMKLICKKDKVLFLDLFNDFKNQPHYTKLLVKEDGIHLNKKGNKYFAKKLITFGKSKKIW